MKSSYSQKKKIQHFFRNHVSCQRPFSIKTLCSIICFVLLVHLGELSTFDLVWWPDPNPYQWLGAGSLMEINVDQFGRTLMSWRAELFSSDRPSRIRSFVGAIPSNVMTQVTCSMISWKKSYLRVFGLGNFLNFLECSRLIRRKRRPRFRKRQVFESLFDLKRSKAVCNLVESTVISKHYTDRLGYSQISCRRL